MTSSLLKPTPLSTGIAGLDAVLGGGLSRQRIYLVEGEPGTGKTTTGLQFLLEGARLGEPVLYITLAESRDELQGVAASHGWDLGGVHVHEVLPAEDMLAPERQYTMYHPSEVEMADMMGLILKAVEELKPTRIVLDSLSELQLLADSPLRYRRQVLALKQFFANRQCTVILLDDRTSASGDLQVRSIAHGVIQLDHAVKDYGTERRRLRVIKYRGHAFSGGMHDYIVHRGGMVVFPRLVAAATRNEAPRQQMGSGIATLDQLMGGGIEAGTSTLVLGPSGTGKSSLSAQFIKAANARGEKAALFMFEESVSNALHRSDGMQLGLREALESGQLSIQQIDPAELTPGQFAAAVSAVVDAGAKVVVIDSLNGYLQAVPDERFLITHLHELLTYLSQHQIMTILVGVQQGMMAGHMASAVDASYLADNVLMLRYFEDDGEIRQAISVFKKRGSAHERTIRSFNLTSHGVEVGPILRGYRGILTGVPVQMLGNERKSDGTLH